MLLFLTFTSLIHLEFFPVYYVGNGSSFILFHMALYLFQCYFLADHHFLTDLRSHFYCILTLPMQIVYFWLFYLVPLVYLYTF